MTPITTTAELAAFCDKIKGQAFVAVDTEFMRETTYWPKLCLIQAAAPSAEATIDPLAEGIDLTPFLDILRDPSILKIDLDKSSRFTDWARRPLSDNQRTYALADVTHLAALYPMLHDRLEREGRLAWVTDEMTDLTSPANYDVEPENAWKRLRPRRHTAKYLAVYKAVAAWRERTAQLRDQPRGRILKDEAIDEIATQGPTDADGLDRLRSVPKGFSGSRFGPDLVASIREALKDPEAYAPVIEKARMPASPAAGAVVELLKVLLKARAEEAGV